MILGKRKTGTKLIMGFLSIQFVFLAGLIPNYFLVKKAQDFTNEINTTTYKIAHASMETIDNLGIELEKFKI